MLQPAFGGDDIALGADTFVQRHAVTQRREGMALFGSTAIEVRRPHRIAHGRVLALRHGAAEAIKRIGVATYRRLLEQGASLHDVARNALAAEVERGEIELGALVALLRRALEQLDSFCVVARRTGLAAREDQRQAMQTFARTGIDRALDHPQPFAARAALDKNRAEPRLGIGIGRCERAQGLLGRYEIAGTIGRDAGAQRWRDVGGCVAGLGVRDRARGEKCREQCHPRRGHFVLNW